MFNTAANTPVLHEAFDQLVLATLGCVPVPSPDPRRAAAPGAAAQFMAQPPLSPAAPPELHRADGAYSPVELAVLRGLGSPA